MAHSEKEKKARREKLASQWKDKADKMGESEATARILTTLRAEIRALKSMLDKKMTSGKLKVCAAAKLNASSSEGYAGSDDILIQAKKAGLSEISIELADPSAPSSILAVTVTEKDIKVDLGTDGVSALNSTLKEVVDAINSHRVAGQLVKATLLPDISGTAVADTAVAKVQLIGGEYSVVSE